MRRRGYRSWGLGLFFGIFALAGAQAAAQAPLVKAGGSPPLIMPNTLLVEAGERLGSSSLKATPAKMGRTVADVKHSPRTCSAVAILVPRQGVRIVTARHCADHRSLEVLDEKHQVTPVAQVDAQDQVDLSVLEVGARLPWPGLEMRSQARVAIGERLCAWRMRREGSGIARERICARLLRRQTRSGADPLLVMSHPYPAGTSGRALVDRRGRVVGIVVASTGYAGLAEPIDGVLRLPSAPKLPAEVEVLASR
jgi:hypothetical protein